MRRVFLSFLLLVAPVVVPVKAQAPTVTFQTIYPNNPIAQCDAEPAANPIMIMCVDWVDPATGTIAGWAIDLRTHHAPTGWMLLSPNGLAAPVPFSVPRPDVAAAYGTPDDNLGFGIVLGPMPTGLYALETSDVPYAWDCWLTPQGMVCDWVSSLVEWTVQ